MGLRRQRLRWQVIGGSRGTCARNDRERRTRMADLQLRSLHRDDIDRVSGIESRITGHSRKGFLEKRFAAAVESPDGFIACAAVRDGKLAGYASSRIQEGEFGAPDAVAVLDVIGIDPDAQGKGIGKALLAEMERRMKTRGIGTLRTQADWGIPAMIRFFSSTAFLLAPVQILERDTSPLREEIREVDYYETLSRDRVPVRSLKEDH